jgi:hypothetical protein
MDMRALGLTAVVFLGLVACGSGSGSGGNASRQFSETCSADGDCVSGLFCVKDQQNAGVCSSMCSGDSDCAKQGAAVQCRNDVCAMPCVGDSDCPSGSACNLTGVCAKPAPDKQWTCTTSGGICTCTASASGGGGGSCPFATETGQVCCERGGPKPDPNTWDTCYCEQYSSIPSGGTCYDINVETGNTYGTDVISCPGGAQVRF